MQSLRHVSIKPDLTLIEVPVDAPAVEAKVTAGRNNIFIADRSGSMSYSINALMDHIAREVKALPAGDYVSVAWFSGEGQYRCPVKNHRITENPNDLTPIIKTIDGLRSTVGLTCFSEVLTDLDSVINESAAFGSAYSLIFLTDGCPVVSNYQAEIQRINAAIDRVKGKVDSALLVGYGDYYNKALMADMAQRIGGALVHADDVSSFAASLNSFLTATAENAGRVSVDLPIRTDANDIVFSLSGKQVVTHQPKDGKVEFSLRRSGGNRVFMLVSGKAIPATSKPVALVGQADLQKESNASIVRGLYAAAFSLAQRIRNDLAIDVLGLLGEKSLVDTVSAAYTPSDCGRAEASIQTAMYFPKERHRAGFVPNCVPKDDAFSVLDLLDLVSDDDGARVFTEHEDFVYKRVGAKTIPREGYPEFTPNREAGSPLTGLTWNDSRLNLSIGVRIDGHVALQGDPAAHGFATNYPTFITRNYTIIRDGNLNVTRLPMRVSQETFAKLAAEGVILAKTYDPASIYTLNLAAIPLVNRAIAKGKTSAADLCAAAIDELRLEARIKTFKWAKSQLDPDGNKLKQATAMTPAQEAYLETQGIGAFGFSPPVDKADPTDQYTAKTFELKIKGFSSLPKIEEVQAKLAALDEAKKDPTKKAKPLTPSQEIIAEALAVYDQDKKRSGTKALLALMDSRIKSAQAELRQVRSKIQRTKFGVVLGQRWFDELATRENAKIEHDGYEFTFSLKEKQIEV